MLLNKKLKNFQKIFSIMGLAPTDMTNERNIIGKDIFKTILCSIPPIVSMFVTLVIFQFSFFPDLDYGPILIILFNAYFLMVTTSNVVASIQCLVHKSVTSVIRRINDISYLFAFRCEREVNYQKFVKSYQIKFFTVCFNWVGIGISSYVIHIEDFSEFIFTTATLTLEILFSMSCMHAILFIDHVGMFTKEMNETILGIKFQSSNFAQKRAKNLVQIKCLHFEIWTLVQQINKYFGWSFVALFTKYLIDITYSLYWTFINFEEFGWKTVLHLGNVLILEVKSLII